MDGNTPLNDLRRLEDEVHEMPQNEHDEYVHSAFSEWDGHEVEHLAMDVLTVLQEKDPKAFAFEVWKIGQLAATLPPEVQLMFALTAGGMAPPMAPPTDPGMEPEEIPDYPDDIGWDGPTA